MILQSKIKNQKSKILSYKKVHCVGIGGIGVSAAAKFFLLNGASVSGSDVAESFITKELEQMGAKIFYSHDEKNLANDVELMLFSPAVDKENPERVKAKKIGISELSYPEFLGELSKAYKTIAVSGTHGKSTTTAMIGLILEAGGLDPLVIVGSRVPEFKNGNLRYGRGEWFVIEACEYQGNMRYIKPHIAVITGVEEDHLDYFKNINNIIDSFQEFAEGIDGGGTLIINGDSINCEKIKPLSGIARKTFGASSRNNWNFAHRRVSAEHSEKQFFAAKKDDEEAAGEWELLVPGEFNVFNALSAIAASQEAGVTLDAAKIALNNFKGIWRRFERLGAMPGVGAHIISDYGHHPTAIRETLKAAREFFPGHRIVLVFQPHQHSRTKALFEGFVKELALTDVLIGVEIYDVAGREKSEDKGISTMDILEKIGKKIESYYAAGPNESLEIIKEIVQGDDVVIIMGAGDIWEIGPLLIKAPH